MSRWAEVVVKAVNRHVLRLHGAVEMGWGPPYCKICAVEWPCRDAAAALDRLETNP